MANSDFPAVPAAWHGPALTRRDLGKGAAALGLAGPLIQSLSGLAGAAADTSVLANYATAVDLEPGKIPGFMAWFILQNIGEGLTRLAAGGAGSVPRLRGQTVAIVGYGRIGSAFGHKAQALGVRVLAVYTYLDPAALVAAGATPSTLDDALPQADAVSIHTPHAPESWHLFGEDQLRRMKPTTYDIVTPHVAYYSETSRLEVHRTLARRPPR